MQYSRGSKFIITVRPKMAAANVVAAATANDMLFDWTGFHFPKHPFAAKLIGVTALVQGLDTALVEEPFILMFAQPNPDGTAPPQIGPEHGAVADPPANGFPLRNYLGRVDVISTDGDEQVLYNAFYQLPNGPISAADTYHLGNPIILGSEPLTTENADHGKLYMCARNTLTPDFGTGVAMNADQAATTTSTTITVKTNDPRKVFSIGDTIHAADGAEVGVLTGFGDAAGSNKDTKLIFGGGIVEALEEDDELINLSPITIRLMFEA